jgi:hypothetical protein
MIRRALLSAGRESSMKVAVRSAEDFGLKAGHMVNARIPYLRKTAQKIALARFFHQVTTAEADPGMSYCVAAPRR